MTFELGPNHLDRLGHRKSPSVERVHGLEVHVRAHSAGAADAGDRTVLLLSRPSIVHHGGELLHDQADAAARAPDRREEIGLQLVLDCHGDGTSWGTRVSRPSGCRPSRCGREAAGRSRTSTTRTTLREACRSIETFANRLDAHSATEQRHALDSAQEHPLHDVGVLPVAALDDDDLLVAARDLRQLLVQRRPDADRPEETRSAGQAAGRCGE